MMLVRGLRVIHLQMLRAGVARTCCVGARPLSAVAEKNRSHRKTGLRQPAGRFLLCFQELRNVDTGFPQDGAKRALCHIARMVGKGDFAPRDSVPPDFMATRTGAVKGESEGAQLAGHFAILEPGEATH